LVIVGIVLIHRRGLKRLYDEEHASERVLAEVIGDLIGDGDSKSKN